jgi:hypothetical protein
LSTRAALARIASGVEIASRVEIATGARARALIGSGHGGVEL